MESKMQQPKTWLHDLAEKQAIPLRTREDVVADLAKAKAFDGGDVVMAKLMLRHGRLTEEARAWIAWEYPQ